MKRAKEKLVMKKFFKILTATALATSIVAGTAAFTACGNDENVIKVAASITPHAEILTEVVKPKLAEEGYTLEVVEFTDYVQPNLVVEQGEADANYFQHNLYLNDFNAQRGTHLKAVAQAHYEPFGAYKGGKFSGNDLSGLPDGAKIGVPNDGTNEARALKLLEKEGLITLKAGIVSSNATKLDIVSNPKNLEIVELEAAQIAKSLSDLAVGIINGNYALQNGLKIVDAIASEDKTDEAVKQYVNVLAVKAGTEDSPKIKALIKALLSDDVKNFIQTRYGGAVVAVF